MRLLKNGVSAVVAASFVLFFAGLAFGQGISISGQVGTSPITMGGEGGPTPVPGATVRVVGTAETCLTEETGPDSGKYTVTIPDEQETFVLKVAKNLYVTTYTIPSGGTGIIENYDIFMLTDAKVAAFYNSATGSDQIAGTSTLMVLTFDPSVIDGDDFVYNATTRVRDSNGALIANSGNLQIRYILLDPETGEPELSTAPSAVTFGYVVFNLPVGSYTVSASKSGSVFGFRPAFTFADCVTAGTNSYNGVLLAPSTESHTGYLTDENQTPVVGAEMLLIGGESNFIATTEAGGAFTVNDVPSDYSAGFLRARFIQDYCDTYKFVMIGGNGGPGAEGEDDTEIIISKDALRQVVDDTDVDTDIFKGHIAGDIRDYYDKPIKGATLQFYDEGGALLDPQPQVFYTASTPGDDVLVDSTLTATSDSGGFVILNLDPEKLIYLRVRVPHTGLPYFYDGYESPLYLMSTFANGITLLNLEIDDIKKGNLKLAQDLTDDANKPGVVALPAAEVPMLQFTLTENTGYENVTLQSVTVTGSGTGNELEDISAVHLYRVGDPVPLGTEVFTVDNGTVTFNLSESIDASTTDTFLVTYDFGGMDLVEGAAAGGETFKASIAENYDIAAVGLEYTISVNGAPATGGEMTIQEAGQHIKATVPDDDWSFDPVTVGESSADKIITITNYGTDPVDITSVDTDFDGADFSIVGRDTALGTLGPGESKTISVAFMPLSAGDKELQLTVNAPGATESPLVVTLTGEGLSAAVDSRTGDSGSLPVGPLAVGISTLLVWWKRRKQRQE